MKQAEIETLERKNETLVGQVSELSATNQVS